MAAAKAKGKKRVRRIQIELPFYRQQVQALELKLERLKLQKHVTSSLQQRPEDPRGISSLVDAASVSTWNAIAERQFKERLRAETKQTELKAAHVELAQLLPELLKLLEKCRDGGAFTRWSTTEILGAVCRLRRFSFFRAAHESGKASKPYTPAAVSNSWESAESGLGLVEGEHGHEARPTCRQRCDS
ncbi:unnamed protein product [Phytophthora lilii]|uniref:Unnamed protein product n=1 Tax=Phytophthora lilii TaxID=2077276 RepID=A0A9W6UAP5_9STRA|nr:unnamed protein product [Phytophthora lilii]